MKKFLSFIAVAVAAVMMYSCEEPEVAAELSVSPESLSFAAAADSKTVELHSTLAWTAEVTSGADWITLSEMSGEAFDGVITVSVTANTNASNRSGRVVFSSSDQKAELLVEQGSGASIPSGLVIPEPIYRPDVFSPVDYVADMAEGGMDGVTIEITGKDTNNFKFQVRPGANVQSYRLDVYPLCRLYNSLYEGARQGGSNMDTQFVLQAISTT